VRGRLSDSEATDDVAEEEAEALDASESVEDAAAECAGRGGAAAPAALTISKSSRRPAGMQDDAIAPPGIDPTNKEKELHPKIATFVPENPIGGFSSAETNREGNPINQRPRMEQGGVERNQGRARLREMPSSLLNPTHATQNPPPAGLPPENQRKREERKGPKRQRGPRGTRGISCSQRHRQQQRLLPPLHLAARLLPLGDGAKGRRQIKNANLGKRRSPRKKKGGEMIKDSESNQTAGCCC